ncbi:hypothetical protein LCGC14_0823660 [marine sediment metagenome]|uniref:Uncharacterized protein n=1 Tax=marine sediment metagenome TaxID=412755 RepID=A0A0F9SQK7_9ZZZZ
MDPEIELQILQQRLETYGSEADFTTEEFSKLVDSGDVEPTPDYVYTQRQLDRMAEYDVKTTYPDWSAPFHMPKFNDDEYLETKAKYVAKYGYTITVPALSDIFHFGKPQPMSREEIFHWAKKDFDFFSDDRRDEIEIDKKHKKDRMLAMLGSPTPELFSQLGAILTAVDDAQDAISTLAAVARIARRIAPKILSRLLGGPIGLILTINDILNLVTAIGSIGTFAGFGKKTKDLLTGSNPFALKAKLKRWRKIRNWKPTFADVIQAAQTTDQIFGVGVSLGPIVGFAQDLFHGMVRQSVGMKVNFKMSPHSVPEWVQTAYRAIKSTAPYMAIDWNSPDDDILLVMQSQAMAQETIMPYQQEWNPLDMVDNIESTEIRCPVPTHPTTLDALDDLGIDLEEIDGWPIIGKTWASPDEITETYAPLVTDTVNKFVERHNHDSMGALACSLVADSAMYQMANIDGEDNVEYDYTVASKLASALLITNTIPLPVDEQTEGAMRIVTYIMEEREALDQPFTAKEFEGLTKQYSKSNQFKFYPSS